MAAALHTSPNRLVHHFGTKEELLAAALRRATQIQTEVRDRWLQRQPQMSQVEMLRTWWQWLNEDSVNLGLVRLGLEAAARELPGLHGPTTATVRAEQVDVWRQSIEAGLIEEGVEAAAARIEASLAKAMFTGLVIDLLATGDRTRLSAALDEGLRRLHERVNRSPPRGVCATSE
jgi:AcrR family transcriptional regulator